MIRVQLRSANLRQAQAHIDLVASQLTDFRVPLEEAAKYVREETRRRFETRGLGEWPQLAESTVARKKAQHFPDPERPLFATGDLYESATSEHGPYSFTIREPTFILLGVDWSRDGWQIPTILSEGNDRIPARPIWPPSHEVENVVSRIIRNWVRAPVAPRALGGAGGVWAGAYTPPLP